jgi:hypothetical protein
MRRQLDTGSLVERVRLGRLGVATEEQHGRMGALPVRDVTVSRHVKAGAALEGDQLDGVSVPLETTGRLDGQRLRAVGKTADPREHRRANPLAAGLEVAPGVDGGGPLPPRGGRRLCPVEEVARQLVLDVEVAVERGSEPVHGHRPASTPKSFTVSTRPNRVAAATGPDGTVRRRPAAPAGGRATPQRTVG